MTNTRPLSKPTVKPTSKNATMTSAALWSPLPQAAQPTTIDSAIVEPTERSMPRVSTTTSATALRIAIGDAWTPTSSRLSESKKIGLIAANTKLIAISTSTGPSWTTISGQLRSCSALLSRRGAGAPGRGGDAHRPDPPKTSPCGWE